MVIEDADSSTEEILIRIRPGPSRSSTIRNALSAVDDWYTERSSGNVQSEDDSLDKSEHDGADSGIRTDIDEREADGGHSGESDNLGESDPQTEPIRDEVDERTPGDTGDPQEPTSDTGIEQADDQRDEPESEQRERERRTPAFHFAPGQHSRGDYVN